MGLTVQKQSDLEKAIHEGEAAVPKIIDLLNSGVLVTSKINHRSPLYYAIERDQTLIAELLLARGASIKTGYYTETPLHIAASRGNVQIARQLVERGAKVNVRNHNGCSPLWLAVSAGQRDIVSLLLGQPTVDVDCPCADAFLLRSVSRSSALCCAVSKQHVKICQLLLEHGASVDMPDIKGCTPLHHACSVGNADIVNLLIQHSCSVDPVNKHGFTPLHTAIAHNHASLIPLLIQAGCNVNLPSRDPCRSTPLHMAAKRGKPHMVAALCSATNIQVDIKDRHSMTPLIVASKYGNDHCLKQLLSADINLLEGREFWSMSRAVCVEDDPQVQQKLQQRMCELLDCEGVCENTHTLLDYLNSIVASGLRGNKNETTRGEGCFSVENIVWSAIHTLSKEQPSSHLDVLHVLIIAGADLHAKDEVGKTAVEYAMTLYGLQAVLLLLSHGATINTERLKTFLAGNYLKPKSVLQGFIFPLLTALMWSSVQYHCLCNSFWLKFSFRNFFSIPPVMEHTIQQPLSLARACRSVVRDAVLQCESRSIAPVVGRLPVPRALKEMLLLCDVLQLMLPSGPHTHPQ